MSGKADFSVEEWEFLRSSPYLDGASPGLLVRGSGFSNPRERSGI